MQRLFHGLDIIRRQENVFFFRRDYDRAILGYQKILSYQPNNVAARLSLVIAKLKLIQQKIASQQQNAGTEAQKKKVVPGSEDNYQTVLLILEQGLSPKDKTDDEATKKKSIAKNINDYLEIACWMIKKENLPNDDNYDGYDFSNVKKFPAHIMLQVLLAKFIYFKNKNKNDVLDWLREPLECGVPEAISFRGLLYSENESEKARELLKVAYVAQEPFALCMDAQRILNEGELTEEKRKKILTQLSTAIQHKYPFALSIRATILFKMKNNHSLFKKLIAEENYYAYFAYAMLLRDGKGDQQDNDRAISLIKKADAQQSCFLLFPLMVFLANSESSQKETLQQLIDKYHNNSEVSWKNSTLFLLDMKWYSEPLLKIVKEKYTPENWQAWIIDELSININVFKSDNEKQFLSQLKKMLLPKTEEQSLIFNKTNKKNSLGSHKMGFHQKVPKKTKQEIFAEEGLLRKKI